MDHANPALASVFLDGNASTSWSKLPASHTLSQFWFKYWGKSIEDEAEQWRGSNPTVDDSTNDILPGCFALDIEIKHRPQKLWVRQDYIRIYNYCRDRHTHGPSSETEIPRSVVITGQPGIGLFLSSVAP